MNYSWSPEQLARINARRARRGQKELESRGMGEEYESSYSNEYSKRQASEKPRRRFPETEEDETQVAKMGEVETPRLDEYKEGSRRMGAPETSRLSKYAGGAFRMGPAETSRLDEYKQRNEQLAQRRRVREMDRGMTAASKMKMMA